MHSCVRIWFICTVRPLYYMCVYHRWVLTPTCVGRRGLFSAFAWLALVDSVGDYVLAACTYTDYLGTTCEPRCATDTWRARRIQID